MTRSWRRVSDQLGGQLTAGWRADAGVTDALLTAPNSPRWDSAFRRWTTQLFGTLPLDAVAHKLLRQRLLDDAPQQRLAVCRAVHSLCTAHVMSSHKRRTILYALAELGATHDWVGMAAAGHHAGWQRCTAKARIAALVALLAVAEDYPAAHLGWAHCQAWFDAGYRLTSGAIVQRLAGLRRMLQTAPAPPPRHTIERVYNLCRAMPKWSQYAASEQWRFVLRILEMPQGHAAASLAHMQRGIGRTLPCEPGNLDRCAAWLDHTKQLSLAQQNQLASLLFHIVGRGRGHAVVHAVADALLQVAPDDLLLAAHALRIARGAQLSSELLAVAIQELHQISPSVRDLVAHVVGKQLSRGVQQGQLRTWLSQAAHLARVLEPWLASLPKDTQRDVLLKMTGKSIDVPYRLCGLWAQINPDTISHAGRRHFLENAVQQARVRLTFSADQFIGLCAPIFSAHIPEAAKMEIISRMMAHPEPERCRGQSLLRAQRRYRRTLNNSFSQLAQDEENVMRHERIDASRYAVAYLRANMPKPKPKKSLSQFEAYLDTLTPQGPKPPTATDLKNTVRTLRGKWCHGDLGMAIKDNETLVMADDRVGIADLFTWVWQAIALHMPQSDDAQEQAQDQANMRHSLVLSLAQCIEADDHRVCAVGISQRLLQVLQGYYPIHLDVITPQARLCALTQEFAAVHSTTEPKTEQLASFYSQAMRLSRQWFTGIEQAHFTSDLHSYLALTYDWAPAPG